MSNKIPVPVQFKRQYSKSLDPDVVFNTTQQMNSYLNNAVRYAGQVVSCLQQQGKIFILSNDRTRWLQVSGSGGGVGTIPIASESTLGGIKIGQGINIDVDGKASVDLSDIQLEQYSKKISAPIVSNVSLGAINQADTISTDTDLQQFVRQLLTKVYYPSFVNPSASLTVNLSTNVQAGSRSDINLVATLNRGRINGKVVNNVWQASQFQNHRVGPASNYVIGGTDMGITNTRVINNYQVIDGSNSWQATISYEQGTQPKDSNNNDFQSPASAGTVQATRNINGRRFLFHGVDTTNQNPVTTSQQVRQLPQTILGPSNGSTFTINIPVGARKVTFAYPATLRNVTSVRYVQGMNAQVRNVFNLTNINVAGSNGFNPIQYKVYTFVPAQPFNDVATYNVTI